MEKKIIRHILDKKFFERDPVVVARELLGNILVHKVGNKRIAGKIVETEAYSDANDLASHASFGKTKRNEIMYGNAGVLYIYHIYGIFFLSNIVCNIKGKPAAILLRAAEIIEGYDLAIENLKQSKFVKVNERIASGPGKLSLAFGLDKTHNHCDITSYSNIFIEENREKFDIIETNRIGIDYAQHCKKYPWRFYIQDNKYISTK